MNAEIAMPLPCVAGDSAQQLPTSSTSSAPATEHLAYPALQPHDKASNQHACLAAAAYTSQLHEMSGHRQEQTSDTATQPGPGPGAQQRAPQHAGALGRLAIDVHSHQQQHQQTGVSGGGAPLSGPSDAAQDTSMALAPASAAAAGPVSPTDMLLAAAACTPPALETAASGSTPPDVLIAATAALDNCTPTSLAGAAAATATQQQQQQAAAAAAREQLRDASPQQQAQLMDVDIAGEGRGEQMGLELLGEAANLLPADSGMLPSQLMSPSAAAAAHNQLQIHKLQQRDLGAGVGVSGGAGARRVSSGGRGGGRARPAGHQGYQPSGKDGIVCQVPGCNSSLSAAGVSTYFRRHRVCLTHAKADSVHMHDQLMRFCQQCGIMHPLADFDGTRKSCRVQLDRHNLRRRCRRKTQVTKSQRKATETSSRGGGSSMSPSGGWGAIAGGGGGSPTMGNGVAVGKGSRAAARAAAAAFAAAAASGSGLTGDSSPDGDDGYNMFGADAEYPVPLGADPRHSLYLAAGGWGQEAPVGGLLEPAAAMTAAGVPAAVPYYHRTLPQLPHRPHHATAAGGYRQHGGGSSGGGGLQRAGSVSGMWEGPEGAGLMPGASVRMKPHQVMYDSGMARAVPPTGVHASGMMGLAAAAASAAPSAGLTSQHQYPYDQQYQLQQTAQLNAQRWSEAGSANTVAAAAAAAAAAGWNLDGLAAAPPAALPATAARSAAGAPAAGPLGLVGNSSGGGAAAGCTRLSLQQLRLHVASAIAGGRGPGLTALRGLGFVQQLLVVDELATGLNSELEKTGLLEPSSEGSPPATASDQQLAHLSTPEDAAAAAWQQQQQQMACEAPPPLPAAAAAPPPQPLKEQKPAPPPSGGAAQQALVNFLQQLSRSNGGRQSSGAVAAPASSVSTQIKREASEQQAAAAPKRARPLELPHLVNVPAAAAAAPAEPSPRKAAAGRGPAAADVSRAAAAAAAAVSAVAQAGNVDGSDMLRQMLKLMAAAGSPSQPQRTNPPAAAEDAAAAANVSLGDCSGPVEAAAAAAPGGAAPMASMSAAAALLAAAAKQQQQDDRRASAAGGAALPAGEAPTAVPASAVPTSQPGGLNGGTPRASSGVSGMNNMLRAFSSSGAAAAAAAGPPAVTTGAVPSPGLPASTATAATTPRFSSGNATATITTSTSNIIHNAGGGGGGGSSSGAAAGVGSIMARQDAAGAGAGSAGGAGEVGQRSAPRGEAERTALMLTSLLQQLASATAKQRQDHQQTAI